MAEYKTTFNYLLSHKVILNYFFNNLELFYETIITNPDNMQIFMRNCMKAAIDIASNNPDIEPGTPVEKFNMRLFGESVDKSIVSVIIPNCKLPPDSLAIAFPVTRKHARYFTLEKTENPLNGEQGFILGEWTQEADTYKHSNYGIVDTETSNGFPNRVIELVYGT